MSMWVDTYFSTLGIAHCLGFVVVSYLVLPSALVRGGEGNVSSAMNVSSHFLRLRRVFFNFSRFRASILFSLLL